MKVTFFLPVYNASPYIEKAISGVLRQTHNDFEFIIINDGSTDDSEEKILSIKDSRIRYFRNDHNLGVAKVGNQGFDLATGDFFARMDADDVVHPKRLEMQLEFLKRNPDHNLVGSWHATISPSGQLLELIQRETKDELIRLNMLIRNQISQSSVMLRTNIGKELRYDESLDVCEDHDLWLRFLDTGKVANIPEYLLKYRWHDSNTSKLKQAELRKTILNLVIKQLKKYEIEYSDEEIIMHSSLTFQKASGYLNSTVRLTAMQSWLSKIRNSNKLALEVGQENLNEFVNNIWETIGLPNMVKPDNTVAAPFISTNDPIVTQSDNIVNSFYFGGALSSVNIACINSFLEQGHCFHLYAYDKVDNCPEGVVIKDANEIIPRKTLIESLNGNFLVFSVFFSYSLLYSQGGWYVDLSSICTKNFSSIPDEHVFASEFLPDYKTAVFNGILKAPKGCRVLRDTIKHMMIQNKKVVSTKETDMRSFSRMIYKNNMQNHIKPPHFFCPIPQHCFELVIQNVAINITPATYAIHCYQEKIKNGLTKGRMPELSLLNRLKVKLV